MRTALAFFLLLGCGKNQAVVAAEALADAVCACPDKACAKAAHEKGIAEAMKHTGTSGTSADEERINAAGQRLQACIAKLKR